LPLVDPVSSLERIVAIVDSKIQEYCQTHTSVEAGILQEVKAWTQSNCENSHRMTGRIEARLLRMLVRLSGARRALEIGTFTGYAALAIAEALPEGGHLTTCEVDERLAAQAQRFFDASPWRERITLVLGSALRTIARATEPFDLVFIDGEKTEYDQYYEAALGALAPRGLIVIDNSLRNGRVLDPVSDEDRTVAALNRKIVDDPRVENVMLTVRDGITLVARRSA
jgi:caffeoyl-CoA O-methyltransferase